MITSARGIFQALRGLGKGGAAVIQFDFLGYRFRPRLTTWGGWLLAALCDIFDVTPNDLIEPYVATSSRRGRKTGTTGTSTQSKPSRNRPTRAVIKPAGD